MKFLPSQVNFLEFFERSADNVLEGAQAFNAMVADYRDLDAKVARDQGDSRTTATASRTRRSRP